MLTVIIASYNHQEYILECLAAAYKIPVENKKIIVIDDGSNDDTCLKVSRFIEENRLSNEVSLVKKKNAGLVNSLNLGISLAETQYLYITASDDVPNAEGIATLVAILEKEKQIDFIIGGGINFFEDGSKIPTYTNEHHKFFSLPIKQQYEALFLAYPHPILLQSTVFRIDVLNKIGRWEKDLILDDYPIFIKLFSRVAELKTNFRFIPEVVSVYYRHHGSNSYKNTLRQFKMVYATIMKLCPQYLLSRTIATNISSYLLSAMKARDFKSIGPMLTFLKIKMIPYFIFASTKKVISKING